MVGMVKLAAMRGSLARCVLNAPLSKRLCAMTFLSCLTRP